MTTIRAFSTSPAKRWGMFSRRYVMMPMAATWALIIGLQAGRLTLSTWVLMAGIVALMAFELFTFIVPLAHQRLLRVLKSLHGELPWLETDFVAWVTPDREDPLRAALTGQQVVVHELDGSTIRTMDELLRALDVPADSRWNRLNLVQRPIAHMTMSLPKDKTVHAFVWRDADVIAKHDPALLHRFVSEWRLQQPTRSLLFFVAPVPVGAAMTPRIVAATA